MAGPRARAAVHHDPAQAQLHLRRCPPHPASAEEGADVQLLIERHVPVDLLAEVREPVEALQLHRHYRWDVADQDLLRGAHHARALVAPVGVRAVEDLHGSEVLQRLADRAGAVDLEREVFVRVESGGALVAALSRTLGRRDERALEEEGASCS